MPFEGPTGEKLRKALLGMIVVLAVFLAAQAVSTVVSMRYAGAGVVSINVQGHGEAVAVPDIATFTYSVVSEKASVSDAQADAATKSNAAIAYLKGAGVAEVDIKTTDYSVSPQYDYVAQVCQPGVYCQGSKQVLRGYQVRQSTAVKVRDTKKAGDLLAGVGSKGATEVSGLTFTFDDPQKIASEAREKAIVDAKARGEVLAKQLGVSLVRVVSFNENGGGQPMSVAYGMAQDSMMAKAAAPEIAVGQNKVTSDVTITYEIR